LISGAVLAGSTNIAVFLVFRFFAGAGAFMILAAVPIWMAEVVPPYLRGALVQFHAIVLVIGYMCASWLGYGIYHWKDHGSANHTWRVPFALQCFFPLCLLLGLYWCPESRMRTSYLNMYGAWLTTTSTMVDSQRPHRGSQASLDTPSQ
jgi:MFS family permease